MKKWTQSILDQLKAENERLKKELEIAKLEAENRRLADEIYALRNLWTTTITYWTPKKWSSFHFAIPADTDMPVLTYCNN